jgi:hypothetical protein
MTHIFSYLDPFTLLSSLPISSFFASAIKCKNVWRHRWVWRTNIQRPLSYETFRHLRNLEIEFLNNCLSHLQTPLDHLNYDQTFELMNSLELNCLLSLCEQIERSSSFSSSSIINGQEFHSLDIFFSHLASRLPSSLFNDRKIFRFIQRSQTTIKFYSNKTKWSFFFSQFHSSSSSSPLDPSPLPSPSALPFSHQFPSLVMEGLVLIADLQPLGCDCALVNSFVRGIVERTWSHIGDTFSLPELGRPLSDPASFPSLGWSLQHPSHDDPYSPPPPPLPQELNHSFQRMRHLVSTLDRLKVCLSLITQVIHSPSSPPSFPPSFPPSPPSRFSRFSSRSS